MKMEVYTVLFMEMGLHAIILGNYSTPDLAIEAMKIYNETMNYSPIEEVQHEVWGAEFSCEQGNYQIERTHLDRMPNE